MFQINQIETNKKVSECEMNKNNCAYLNNETYERRILKYKNTIFHENLLGCK